MTRPVARRTRRSRSSESRRASWVERSEPPSGRKRVPEPRRSANQDWIFARRVIVPPIQQRTASARFGSGSPPSVFNFARHLRFLRRPCGGRWHVRRRTTKRPQTALGGGGSS